LVFKSCSNYFFSVPKIVSGAIDTQEIARGELVLRGIDTSGKWIGKVQGIGE
jgi:hypothetical protein